MTECQPTTETFPSLAPQLSEPRLRRVVAVEPAQLSIQRRRRWLRRILRIEARQSSESSEETAREICILGRSERRGRRGRVKCGSLR